MAHGELLPIITGKSVRLAIRDTVRSGLRTFLDAIGVEEGREPGALPNFRSYPSAFDTDKYEEDQLPACVIVAPGLLDPPTRRGSGAYEATWAVALAPVIVGQNRENTFELVEMYTAAVRTTIVQARSLGGFASGTKWLDERYDELSGDDVRTIAAGIVQFAVTVETVVDDRLTVSTVEDTHTAVSAR